MPTTENITAIRYGAGDKARITVTYADGTTSDFGGKRCQRAAAVLLVRWPEDTDGLGFYGARGDLAGAQAEARRLMAPGKHRRPCAEAVAIPVTDQVPTKRVDELEPGDRIEARGVRTVAEVVPCTDGGVAAGFLTIRWTDGVQSCPMIPSTTLPLVVA